MDVGALSVFHIHAKKVVERYECYERRTTSGKGYESSFSISYFKGIKSNLLVERRLQLIINRGQERSKKKLASQLHIEDNDDYDMRPQKVL